MSLNDIVDVQITALTTAPSRVGFGTPLVTAFHTVFPERARAYTSTDAMVDDGFDESHAAVLAVQALLAQNPKPSRVIVGREVNTEKRVINIYPVSGNLKASYDYIIYVNGKEAKFTTDATPTVAEIVTGLKSAVDALTEPVTTTDSGTYLEIEDTTLGGYFRLEVKERAILTMEEMTADGSPDGIVSDLMAIREENDDWYCYVPTCGSKAVILAAAAYIETLIKEMAAVSGDDEILDSLVTDDVGSELKAAAYARTFLIFHTKPTTEYANGRWVGKCLPKDPGSITWKFKTLAGLTVDKFSETEVGVLRSKVVNFYQAVGGINITEEGYSASGEFIDITNGVDFMRARLQESIFARLANADKIPYTDKGAAVVEAEVRAVLKLCIGQGILSASPEPTVTVPLVADVSFTDRANRLLPDVKFEATLAGAIHAVQVRGTVTV